MNRLLEIGFQHAGHWQLDNNQLVLELNRFAGKRNILYAFVCDGEIKYIGKTVSALAVRMGGYRNPGRGQSTNIRNHERIREMLLNGVAVEIFALPDDGLLHYGPYHLNLAAGLEDDLIRVINPEWNGGRKEPPADPEHSDTSGEELVLPIEQSFAVTLHPTYYWSGFFNVGAKYESHIGADGEVIELYLGQQVEPILGTINRRVNENNTPRIMGGVGLRNWFAANAAEMDLVQVDVLSPTAIRLHIEKQ